MKASEAISDQSNTDLTPVLFRSDIIIGKGIMKKFVVISHSHWDREWYMPFELFRLRLVDLVDRLIDIIENDPDYIFHLDAQTVVLEDYLVIRPENEQLLKKYIAAGNIIVGPWYLQSDFYLTDGESTIRNLQRGISIAARFGACSKVGYAPDQFGNVSQLPQIFKDFDIDTFVFGRGYSELKKLDDGAYAFADTPAEFIWRGADGSECLAVCLKRWYNNAQRIPFETEYAKMLLDMNDEFFSSYNVTPYILLMNGVDHLEAQDDLLTILKNLRAEGVDIEQTTLDKYLDNVKQYVKDNKSELSVYEGALNKGDDYNLLKGCWSSRIYLKQSNVAMEDMLEVKLEPLYSYLLKKGASKVYPDGELDYVWKNVLQNQPHDSICGCSRDEVHAHMEDSYARMGEIGGELVRRGMVKLAAHAYSPLKKDENYSVTVFNPTEAPASLVVRATLDFIASEEVKDFAVYAPDGSEVEYEVISKERTVRDVFSPLNLPGVLDVDRCEVELFCDQIPPYTPVCYAVVPGKAGKKACKAAAAGYIENEYYKISNEGSSVCITDKRASKTVKGAIAVEDSADRGDSYVYRPFGEPIICSECTAQITEQTAYTSKITYTFNLTVPAEFDFKGMARSQEATEMPVCVTLALNKGSGVIGVSYSFVNTAKDHRVRLIYNLGFADKLFTDAPFDFAEKVSMESCIKTDSDTHHASTFALAEGEANYALLHSGQHEYQRTENGMAVTVMRATGVINRNGVTFESGGGAQWDVPGNQCLGRTVCGSMAMYLGKATPAECFVMGKQFRVGLLAHADSFDTKKYAGGRFALQTAELNSFYYVKDPCEGNISNGALFKLEGEGIVVSCVKKGTNGGLIVRICNMSDEVSVATLTAEGDIYLTNMAESKEKLLANGEVSAELAPKQIVTFNIK